MLLEIPLGTENVQRDMVVLWNLVFCSVHREQA